MSCARVVAFSALAALFGILTVNACPDSRFVRYYNELGCSPLVAASNCPVGFDCGDLNKRDSKKCWLKGQQYAVGDEVIPKDSPCTVECSCRMDGKRADLSCINNECPENFGEPPLEEGCYHKYELDKCCSTGTQCVNNDTERSVTKCEYDGKDVFEGQLLFKSDDPCKICICNRKSDDEPSCREVSCGLELHWAVELQKGCAPVFYGGSTCCPIQWRCPRPGDRVVARKTKKPYASRNSTEPTCLFAGLQLRVGEFLVARGEKRSSCQQCSCQLPPHVTCIQKPHCKSNPWRSRRALDPCARVRCVRGCHVGNDGQPHCVP